MMVAAENTQPVIAIDPYAKTFMVAPALAEDERELELLWDGVRLTFQANDQTPFDEGVVEAVALKTQAALAPEFGDAAATAREYARQADERVSLLYVESLRRKRVASPQP